MKINENIKNYVENAFVLMCVTLWLFLIAALVYEPINWGIDMSSMTKHWITKYDEMVVENKKLFAENIALKRKLAVTITFAFSIIAYATIEMFIGLIGK